MTYLNPCLDPTYTTISAQIQTDPPANNYSGTDSTYSYNPFTVDPNFCPLSITCEGDVTGPSSELTCPTNPFSGTFTNNFDESDYKAGLITPGNYIYTFKVSTGGINSSLNPTFTVT